MSDMPARQLGLAHGHHLVIHEALSSHVTYAHICSSKGDPNMFDGEERCRSGSHLNLGQEGLFRLSSHVSRCTAFRWCFTTLHQIYFFPQLFLSASNMSEKREARFSLDPAPGTGGPEASPLSQHS